jgi:cytochrome c oxidase assembly protein subunit 15
MTVHSHPQAAFRSPWPHRLAVTTAAATLLLIFVGGVVTNTGSGLAVPDWPTTFGYDMFLFPWSKMVGGILYEHSHRLLGAAVGLLTIALAIALWAADARRWVRWLGVAAVAAVIVQGVLGGLRVVLVDQSLAIVHGCFAQAFFALLVALAVPTSRWWHESGRIEPPAVTRSLQRFSIMTAALVYVQIAVGALVTHIGGRWLDLHVLVAVAVVAHVVLLARRVLAQHAERIELRRPALGLLALTVLQWALGLALFAQRMGALLLPPGPALLLPTTHRITAALILAVAVMLALRLLRLAPSRQAVVAVPESLSPLRSGHGSQVTA